MSEGHSDAAKTARPPGKDKYGHAGVACMVGRGDDRVEEMTKYHVALDNCTDVSIFMNKDLLTRMRNSEYVWTVTGHKRGSDLVLNTEGDFYDMTVMYSRGASCNILCQADVESACETYVIPNWGARVMSSAGPLDFVLTGKRYILDTRKPVQLSKKDFSKRWKAYVDGLVEKSTSLNQTGQVFIGARKWKSVGTGDTNETVQGNAAKYTLAERTRAAEAIDLIRKSGFKSPATIAAMLSDGHILNCDLTYADIERGLDIYGRPQGYWEGKMKERKAAPVVTEYLEPITKKHQVAHCDIMYIDGRSFLVAVVNPMNLGVAVMINNHNAQEVQRAINAISGMIALRGCTIHTLIHDPEKAIVKAAGLCPGIRFEETEVNGHVPIAERFIEEIKETARSVIHSLPYEIPRSWIPALVTFAVIRRNSVPNKNLGKKMTPREVLLGRKVNYKKDYALGFGDFVKLYKPNVKKNTMQRRSMDAIALYPTGAANGAWVFLHLETMHRVVRSWWRVEPLSDLTIAFLNNQAAVEEAAQQRRGNHRDADIFDDVPAIPADDVNGLQVQPEVVGLPPEAVADIQPGELVVEHEDDNDAVVGGPELLAPDHTLDINDVDIAEPAVQDFINAVAEPGVLAEGSSSGDEVVADEEPVVLEKRTRSGASYLLRLTGQALAAGKKKKISQSKAIRLYKQKAMDSMFSELCVLDKKGTWTPVDPNTLSKQELKRIIRSFMFLTEKYDAEGEFLKLKSRLVAMGNEQDKELLDMDVSSPTVCSTSVYTVAAIAAAERRYVLTLDIGGAFLNALVPSGETIMVKLDAINSELLCQMRPDYRPFLNERRELTVKLEKALYGCIQSARLWYDTFSAFLYKLGYKKNERDACVFNKLSTTGVQCTVCFHVDDVMITSEDKSMLDEFESAVTAEYEQVSVTKGDKHSYLGRLFDFSEEYKCKVSMNGFFRAATR